MVKNSGNQFGSFTHIGVVLSGVDDPSELGVVHASPYGAEPRLVRWEPLTSFLADSKITSWKILRWNQPGDEQTVRQAIQKVSDYLKNNTPFDDLFDGENDSALYCTELVARAYSSEKRQVPKSEPETATVLWFRRQLHFPDSFDRDSRFRTVEWVKNW